MAQPGSAYSLEKRDEKISSHTLTVLVDNEPGVLARVIGLFSGRGYNIDSLTVSETEHEAHLSRITIVTSGPPMVIEQIQHQLERLVPVHSVTDLTVKGNPIERELAMGEGGSHARLLRSECRSQVNQGKGGRHHQLGQPRTCACAVPEGVRHE